jgi:DNA repair protein RAD16
VIELPPVTADENVAQPKGFGSTLSKPRRSRPSVSYTVKDSDEDDEEEDELTGDAALARQLQQEEYEQVPATTTNQPSSSKLPVRRRTRASASAMDLNSDEDDDDDDFDPDAEDILSMPMTSADPKGKGKAVAKPRNLKRAAPTPRRALSPPHDSDDDEDEPLASSKPARKKRKLAAATLPSTTTSDADDYEDGGIDSSDLDSEGDDDDSEADSDTHGNAPTAQQSTRRRRAPGRGRSVNREQARARKLIKDRKKLEKHHPQLLTMWKLLEDMPRLKAGTAEQPKTISRRMKPFQLEGLAWMKAMEATEWKGGLLGDEMGLGKTIQAVSLIMSDYPASNPTLVLVPPVALLQWTAEIESYTDGTLKTLVFHGTNAKAKKMSAKDLKKYDVILMSYNSLESVYRKQEKGFARKEGLYKEKSAIHQIKFHRVILDEAHCIKVSS